MRSFSFNPSDCPATVSFHSLATAAYCPPPAYQAVPHCSTPFTLAHALPSHTQTSHSTLTSAPPAT